MKNNIKKTFLEKFEKFISLKVNRFKFKTIFYEHIGRDVFASVGVYHCEYK